MEPVGEARTRPSDPDELRRVADEGLLLGELDEAFHPPAGAVPRAPVVALVGSAGGIEAVSRVLGGLPEDFGAAVVVLVHLAPERVSRLAEILRRRCRLPVVDAVDGLPLWPGAVLVAPAGRHVLVTPDGAVALIQSGEFPPSRPSADLLLATLATAVRRRAVAVILSGGGHDGATGATAVHALGGTVLATDEATSERWEMPRAAIERDAIVDRVVALEDVAGALLEVVAARVRASA
ncbi:MAG TPA: chemotaxis protein CheB [Baekduia sp.]|nr:chemotaxis protein CheB [Baekduia sp.]